MKINETIRKDGLRIISCHVPNKRSVQVELISRVGSAYDPADHQGLFHCFEHMAFKGTKTRSIEDLQSFSAKNLFGGNAATGTLGTTYDASVVDRKMPEACEYLCDIYFNSTFPARELKKKSSQFFLKSPGETIMTHRLHCTRYSSVFIRRIQSVFMAEGLSKESKVSIGTI